MAEPSEVKAVIDTNEASQNPDLLSWVDDHPEIDDWVIHSLDAADLVVCGIGFERKSPADFAASLTDGRLDSQATKLAEAFDAAYILLEGGFSEFGEQRRGPPAKSLRGKAARLTADGIPVIPCDTQQMLVDMAVRLGRKHTEESSSSSFDASVVTKSEPSGKRMWGCIDGIGPAMADRLYESKGSPPQFARESQFLEPADPSSDMMKRLLTVDGIGEKTAESIVDTLTE